MSCIESLQHEVNTTRELERIESIKQGQAYQKELQEIQEVWGDMLLNSVFAVASEFNLPSDEIMEDLENEFIDNLNYQYTKRIRNDAR